MLKTIALLGALTAVTLPGACSSQQPTAAQVVAAVQAACQFTPTAQSIEAVLQADSTVTQIQDIVNIICTAVGPVAPASVGKAKTSETVTKNVYVNGKVVVISGTYN